MKRIFNRIIAKLEDISERDDFGSLVVDLDEAISVVFEVKNEYENRFVSTGLFEQYKWERDVAISQLEDLGIGFARRTDDIVAIKKEEFNKLLEYKAMYEDLCR